MSSLDMAEVLPEDTSDVLSEPKKNITADPASEVAPEKVVAEESSNDIVRDDPEDPTVCSINEITSINSEAKDSDILERAEEALENESLPVEEVEVKTEETHLPVVEQEQGSFHEESSDEGSEYKDAVNPPSGNDQVSDCESQDLSERSSDSNKGRRRENRDEELKGRESDEDSLNKDDESNEDDPPGARESGDGEEKSKEKVLDRDEDKKDPQYIPKKGMFYEHDDRTCEGEAPPPVKEDVKEKKKKVVADKMDRWGHDMFDVNKQTPKSTQDLIDFYGYDIRNEEEAPKAWRSRRYGRGPNKYTRQWQDEAAYHNKRATAPPNVRPQGPFKPKEGDFPSMEETGNYRGSRGRGGGDSYRGRGSFNKPKVVRDRPEVKKRSPQNHERRGPPQAMMMEGNKPQADKQSPREPKARDIQIEKTVFLNRKKPFSSTKTKTEAEAEADIAALSKEFSNAVINIGRDGKILPIRSTGGGNAQSSPSPTRETPMKEQREEVAVHVAPAQVVKEKVGRSESAKSKRYSSQRQRSLPQSNHIQQQQQQQQFLHQQQYFPPPPPPQATAEPPESNLYPAFPNQTPPNVFPESMQSVVFLPPQYQPTPPPHLLNYSLPPPPPQQYIPAMAPPPPPEMFPAPPPGITYYSPQNQVTPRPPSRRVKVAIPIIAPPEQSINQPES